MIESSRGYHLLDKGEDQQREGHPDAARRSVADAISNFRYDCDLGGEATALCRQARIARACGDLAWAQHDQQAAIALLRKAGDGTALARALADAGDLFLEVGELAHAAASLNEAFELYEIARPAPLSDIADAVRTVARLAEAMGEPEQARRMWVDARDRLAAGDAPDARIAEAEARIAALG
ncbi:hypothetical protein [Sphingomonas sp.]|uniref:hypothetical protein n=1 Tax=Sphingomonas sp. TaxID=28214 RepID=UPI001ECFC9E8|nr:hypothetical protein [Sphingomonas sp.]MBX3595629.1 hypothetical protein [Sphingomonas sp.]